MAACFEPSALTISDCFCPSAQDRRRLFAFGLRHRRAPRPLRRHCFSIVSRMSSGGTMFFSSMRITLTHCAVAASVRRAAAR
jgi:hypothetical protein